MKRVETETLQYPKTLIVGIISPYNPTKNPESYLEEFVNLVKSNGIPFYDKIFLKLRSIDPGHFISSGKLIKYFKLSLSNSL